MDFQNAIVGNRYEIEQRLGSGGYGDVYKAFDTKLQTPVAIKFLKMEALEPGSRDLSRFENEARMLAKLRHPNVVAVIDFDVHERQPYFVMEFLQGADLEDSLQSGPLPLEKAFEWFSGALDGLAQAHAIGIVHKDLKPGNLFVDNTHTERLVVVDYGIGRDIASELVRFTSTGRITGTPSYLPPEYILDGHVGPQNDVYQMGLIIIEALTGQKAIRGATMLEIIQSHRDGALAIPARFRDHPWFPVLMTATALHHDERYPTASEFLQALRVVHANPIPTVLPDRLEIAAPKREIVERPAPMSLTPVQEFEPTRELIKIFAWSTFGVVMLILLFRTSCTIG